MAWEVKGIDVSEYQQKVIWNTAIDQGISFAFVRACSGATVDEQFERNSYKLPEKGLPHGYYFPYYPNIDWKYQADVFCDLIEDLPWNLPPVIDAERRGDWSTLDEIAEYVELRLGVRPMIYCSPGVWNDEIGDVAWASEYLLWVAFYTDVDLPPYLPAPWDEWIFWQWSAGGNGKGAKYGAQSEDIDLDRFNGSIEDLDQIVDEVWETRFGPPPDPQTLLEQRVTDLEEQIVILNSMLQEEINTNTQRFSDNLAMFGKILERQRKASEAFSAE